MALGTDIAGGVDLDPGLRVVGGQRALAKAIVRRLSTDLGALQDHPQYGFNIENIIGTTMPESVIQQRIRQQCLDEEEVEEAEVVVTKDRENVYIQIRLTAGEGPFLLTVNVNDLGIEAIIPSEI